MRITELQAINAVRKDARRLSKTWDYSDHDEIPAHILKRIAKYGFEPIGSPGSSGFVAQHEDYPYVLKIFGNDTAYIKWLAFCKKNQSNPYVPKVKGAPLNLGSNVYAVRLELLKYSYPFRQHNIAMEFRDAYVRYNKSEQIEDIDYDYIKSDPQLFVVFDAIKSIISTIGGGFLDMHEDNIMWRGNQFVVIDPVAG